MQEDELERIKVFFDDEISTEDFAQQLRRIQHVLATHGLNDDSDHKEWISSGYYWLHQFLEAIKPDLSKTA